MAVFYSKRGEWSVAVANFANQSEHEMNEVAGLLEAAHEVESENQITLEDVRRWLNDYLKMRGEEVTRFPEEKDLPHWDLLAADFDCEKDAQFLLAHFRDGRITFVSGRRKTSNVRGFAPENVDLVLDELNRQFWIAGRASVTADDVLQWLMN